MKYIALLSLLLSSCAFQVNPDGSKSGQVDPSVGDRIYDWFNRDKENVNP